MPASSATLAANAFALDEATHTIRFERDLACTEQQAFDAWTRAEQIRLWWDPTGEPLAVCEIDLRVGGGFSFTNRAHPERPFAGVYREIAPPHRLVFEAMGSVGRVLLEPRGAGTHMTVEITCTSQAHLQQFVEMGVATGTAQTLDNLVARMNEAGSRGT
ncbi:MAG TPA: SRPBCC domain-containing protein [Phenylobacterium sp.]